MAAKPSAVVLCPEVPYPAIGGGALRSAALLEHLHTRYRVDLIVFRQPDAPDPRATRLADIAREINVIDLPFHRRHGPARALRNLSRLWRGVPPLTDRFSGFERQVATLITGRRYELALIEHFWCAPYASVLSQSADSLVLDLHNIESVLHGHCARNEPWPLSALHHKFERACRALERRWFPEFNRLLVASDDDATRVRAIVPEAHAAVFPNTIPLRPQPPREEADALVFSGNLEYHPNTNAIAYFRDRVWPGLRKQHPELVWRLVGKNADAVRASLTGDARIQLTGAVEDAITELAAARVAVVPLQTGSGTRVKILEAWAAGTPVVSTTIGAEGLPAVPGEHLLIADSPGEFGEAVSRLLRSPELRGRIGAAGRALYEREFTWEAGWRKLAALGL